MSAVIFMLGAALVFSSLPVLFLGYLAKDSAPLDPADPDDFPGVEWAAIVRQGPGMRHWGGRAFLAGLPLLVLGSVLLNR